MLVGGPQAALSPRVSPSEVQAFAKAVEAAQRLPQHNPIWERHISLCGGRSSALGLEDGSPLAQRKDSTEGSMLLPMGDSDEAIDVPDTISPEEMQDSQEASVIKAKRFPHMPTEEELSLIHI